MFDESPDDQLPPGLKELMDALGNGDVAGIHAIKVPEGVNGADIPSWALLLTDRLDTIANRLSYLEPIMLVLEARALITPGYREALNFLYTRRAFGQAKGAEATVEAGNEMILALKALEATGLATDVSGLADQMREQMDGLLETLAKMAPSEDGDCDAD